MIRIIPAEPPHDFYQKVELKGEKWLLTHSKDESLPRWWADYYDALYERYNGICAYTGMWISEFGMSLDHFLPKSKYPQHAFKWNNYRLTSSRINSRKSDKMGILDPFDVPDGAFRIQLDTGVVSVRESAFTDVEQLAQAHAALKILPMGAVSRMHMRWLDSFIQGNISPSFLRKVDPFLYAELLKQKFLK